MSGFDRRGKGPVEAAVAVRLACRQGHHRGHTAGMAPGCVQGNVCILPRDWAIDFAAFCQRNPKPCPIIGMSAVGNPTLPDLGDIDIRTDVPRYRVFRDGRCIDEPTDIRDLWRDDLVAFVIGCSFSFEEALLAAGYRPTADRKRSRTEIADEPEGPTRGSNPRVRYIDLCF